MGSSFLDNLSKMVNGNEVNEDIKNKFNEIIKKSDNISSDKNKMNAVIEKAINIDKTAKEKIASELTAEKVEELNKLAKTQEDNINKIHQNDLVKTALFEVKFIIETLTLKIEKYKAIYEELKEDNVSLDEKVEFIMLMVDEVDKLKNDHDHVSFERKRELIKEVVDEIKEKETND